MARVANPRNAAACLILGAYHVAADRAASGRDFTHWSPRPLGADLDRAREIPADALVPRLEAAIRAQDQAAACAITQRIGSLGLPEEPVFALLCGFAVTEDGALHAEKFYRTVREEFAASRPAFRWRHLVALARVTASEFGRPAPGVAEATERLRI
jgi:hypothetical protein